MISPALHWPAPATLLFNAAEQDPLLQPCVRQPANMTKPAQPPEPDHIMYSVHASSLQNFKILNMLNLGNPKQSPEALHLEHIQSFHCARGGCLAGIQQGGLHYSFVNLELHMLLHMLVLPEGLQPVKSESSRLHSL